MEVILQKKVESLGNSLDIVKVSAGYARNFLIPQGLAVIATESNKKTITENIRQKEAREQLEVKKAKALARKMEAVSITIPVKVKDEVNLFGSVTDQNIMDALKVEGFEIEKHLIDLPEHIKELGVYTVPVKLYKDVSAKVKVWVVKEAE